MNNTAFNSLVIIYS